MALPLHNPMFPNSQLPSPDANDSAEVVQCLLSAQSLWQQGQVREAVRSLQRGAEAAEQDGDDLRALGLARVAADLSAHAEASTPPSSARTALGANQALPAGGASEAEATSEANETSAVRSSPSGAPRSSPSASPAPAPSSSAAALPRSSPFAAPALASGASASLGAGRSSLSRRPTQQLSSLGKRASRAPDASGASEASDGPALSGELRVSVKRSSLDPSLFIVRPLAPKAAVPAGAREARLVFDPEPKATDKT